MGFDPAKIKENDWAKKSLRPVYKPHSVHGAKRHWAIISLGGASPRRSMRPTRDWLSHHMRERV